MRADLRNQSHVENARHGYFTFKVMISISIPVKRYNLGVGNF